MKLDNQRNTYRLWLQRLLLTLVFTLLILVILFIPWFKEGGFWLGKYHLVIFVSLVYILINLNSYLKRPGFVYFSDQGEMIVLRYYPLSLFTSRKNSIEIPKSQLVRYELKPFYFKSQQWLILYQNFRQKTARYPPISLSAVDKADREKIIKSLDKYAAPGRS